MNRELLHNNSRYRTHLVEQLCESTEHYQVAGRIVSYEAGQLQWKALLKDRSGTVQLMGDQPASFSEGDIVSAEGRFKANVLYTKSVTLLVRSIEPNVTEAPSYEVLRARESLVQLTRDFFRLREFLEIETPALSHVPDLALAIRCFETLFETDSGERLQLFLHTSPEHHMKRLLTSGIERIFQITKFFRNGESGRLHNPEFTGLEWYEAFADYSTAMDTTEALITFLANTYLRTQTISWQGHRVHIDAPWQRKPFFTLIREKTGLELEFIQELESLRSLIEAAGYHTSPSDDMSDLLLRVFVHSVEPYLGFEKPIFVTDYPLCMGAMAQRKPSAPHLVERFELYIAGVELCNGYSELNDPEEQYQRFLDDCARKFGTRLIDIDHGLLHAMKYGIPPTTGNALGLDRLIMLLLDQPSIEAVRLFPFSRDCAVIAKTL